MGGGMPAKKLGATQKGEASRFRSFLKKEEEGIKAEFQEWRTGSWTI